MEKNQNVYTRNYDNSLDEPPKKMKKRIKILLSLLAIAVVAALAVVLIGPQKVMNKLYKTFAGKATYYAWIEKNNAKPMLDLMFSSDRSESSSETEVKVLFSDSLTAWLPLTKEVVLRSNSNQKNGEAYHEIRATYGGQELVQLDTYSDVNEDEYFIKVPQLSEKYVAVNSSENSSENSTENVPVMNILKEARSSLIGYFYELIKDSAKKVTYGGEESLTINDETIKASQITVTFPLDQSIGVLINIAEQIKIDEELMDIADENGIKKSEYKTMINELISLLQTYQYSLHGEEELVSVCYVDDTGSIVGRTLSLKVGSYDYSISYLVKESKENLHIVGLVGSMGVDYLTLDITSKEKETGNEFPQITQESVVDLTSFASELSDEKITSFVTGIMDQLGLSAYEEIILPLFQRNSTSSKDSDVATEVILGNYKGIIVAQPETKVTEEDLQEEIISFTQYYSNMMPITDRDTVEDGDIVVIDYVGTVDGVEFDGGTATDYELEIGSNMFVEGFEAQLIGNKVGDQVVVRVTFPKDYSNTELAGMDAEFDVTIDALGLREFTDAFVAYNTEYETTEEYRDYLYEGLVDSKEYDAQSEIEETILTAIIEDSTFYNISDGEIEAKREEILSTYESYADYYEVDLETYADSVFGISLEEFYDEIDYFADLYVKESYVMAEIAEQEQITLTEQEYAKRLSELKESYGYESEEEIETEYGGKEELTTVFLEEKVLGFLKSVSVFN